MFTSFNTTRGAVDSQPHSQDPTNMESIPFFGNFISDANPYSDFTIVDDGNFKKKKHGKKKRRRRQDKACRKCIAGKKHKVTKRCKKCRFNKKYLFLETLFGFLPLAVDLVNKTVSCFANYRSLKNKHNKSLPYKEYIDVSPSDYKVE